jgi:hypothetical protein
MATSAQVLKSPKSLKNLILKAFSFPLHRPRSYSLLRY